MLIALEPMELRGEKGLKLKLEKKKAVPKGRNTRTRSINLCMYRSRIGQVIDDGTYYRIHTRTVSYRISAGSYPVVIIISQSSREATLG